jgi:ATP-dependent helicase/nuclease subunit B
LNADGAIELVPYGDDPLQRLAELLLARHHGELPDLSRHTVLLPQVRAASRLRTCLLAQARRHGRDAMLPPACASLSAWARRFCDPRLRVLGPSARVAKLLAALRGFPRLQAHYGLWPLVDSLLMLFDELTTQSYRPPADLPAFRNALAEGYGAPSILAPLADEAALVHTLWRAWNDQLAAEGSLDEALAVQDGLRRSLEALAADVQLYVVGFATFTASELDWIAALRLRGQITVILQGNTMAHARESAGVTQTAAQLGIQISTSDTDAENYTRFLDRVFAASPAFRARVAEQAIRAPQSPAAARLRLHAAADAEAEARAVELQVRRWRLAGLRNIGIVTHDRKLARRVRALLERANIALTDSAGWALSTTSAATALHAWLEVVQSDFARAPLLELLKSPFVTLASERATLAEAVLAFEQKAVLARGVSSGLARYRAAVAAAALPPATQARVDAMLDALHQASQALRPLLGGPARPAGHYFAALDASLAALGVRASYEQDEAGNVILEMLDELHATLTDAAIALDWAEFCAWLRRDLERRRFHTTPATSGVELMALSESALHRFDALVIAGATHEHLPGTVALPPFFNDGVRARLGLARARERQALALHHFRALLEAVPQVLITRQRERDGETLVPSPWVQRLQAFHGYAYDDDLRDPQLERLVQHPDTELTQRASHLPTPARPARVAAPSALLPAALTASAHQALIDCPYQYFCGAMLRLRPIEPPRDELEKSDYGQRVHRILHAFHSGVPGLPGPWRGPLTSTTRTQAQALLVEISHAAFGADLKRSGLARAWLNRWLAQIDAYLDWATRRAEQWTIEATELERSRTFSDGATEISITGRLDRLDRNREGVGIVDYKTGVLPDLGQMRNGENCQLAHYALLAEESVAQVSYVGLQADGVRDRVQLEGQELTELTDAARTRLLVLKRALDAEAELPAWGDAEVCARCNASGVCRKEYWSTEPHA